MDGAAEGRGSDGGSRTGRAIEVNSAKPLRGEEGPRVVGRCVGVVERDSVEVDVVVAIGKAAEVGLRLAEADAIAIGGEGAGCHLDRLAIVCRGSGEVLDERRRDLRAGRGRLKEGIHGSECGGYRALRIRFDRDLLGEIADGERHGNILRAVLSHTNTLDGGTEAGRSRLHAIGARGETRQRKVTKSHR